MSIVIVIWFIGCFLAILAGIYSNKILKKIIRHPLLTWVFTIPIALVLGAAYAFIGRIIFFNLIPSAPEIGTAVGNAIGIILTWLLFIGLGMISFILASTSISIIRLRKK